MSQIVIRFANISLEADAEELARAMWLHMPPMIINPDSAEAREHATMRTLLKGPIKSLGPMLLKFVTGQEWKPAKGEDSIVSFTQYMVASVVAGMASQEWTIDVEESGQSGVYHFRGITPGTESETRQLEAAAAD
jgi:hypothetical protein